MSDRSVRKLDEGARNRFSSSRLVQLLQQWQLLEPPAQWPGLGDQLARWMGWADAVSLAAVLSGGSAAAAGAPLQTRPAADARGALTPTQAREGLARVRASLLSDIANDPLFSTLVGGKTSANVQVTTAPDFAACRRQHQAHQRAMERQLAPWRQAVRQLLARHGPPLAPLAALDAVMADALGERESHLLARLPWAMERHFARLCGDPASASPAGPGLASFIIDLQALLRAELAFRLEPMEGMLEALNMTGLEASPLFADTCAELPT